ncbi:MAG: Kelch repeat-containing protein [Promethearchaeota archaeon]
MKKSTHVIIQIAICLGALPSFLLFPIVDFRREVSIHDENGIDLNLRESTLVREDWSDFIDGTLENLTVSTDGDLVLDNTSLPNSNWTKMDPPTAPRWRYGPGMGYDEEHDMIILFGGATGTSYYGDTWVYDVEINNWTNLDPTNKPGARGFFPMVYDSENGRIVLFSGYNGGSQTWAYDVETNNWTNLMPPSPPSWRYGHSMAYASKHQKIVMYGGYNGNYQTWVYDVVANNWTNMNPLTRPNSDFLHAMTYDPINDKLILFGGYVENIYDPYSGEFTEINSDETWVYDVETNNWTNMNPITSPPERKEHAMVFDTKRGKSILFGGSNESIYYDDTWVYDLTTNEWLELNTPSRPSGRLRHAMAYDSKRDKLVLFGGYPFNAETWTLECGLESKGCFRSKVLNLYDIYNISGGISWIPEQQLDGTDLKLQIGFSNTTIEDDFVYTIQSNASFAFNGIGQYISYKAHFDSNGLSTSPILSKVEMFFVENEISSNPGNSGVNGNEIPSIPGYDAFILLGIGTFIIVLIIRKNKHTPTKN